LSLFDHGDLAFIRHVGVRNAYRGRGIASALIRRGLALLQQRGQTRVDLGVDAEDEVGAAAIYERLGFQTLQRTILVERRL
jgi:ribosomal protein S18 acetylase RimI-like enzyme